MTRRRGRRPIGLVAVVAGGLALAGCAGSAATVQGMPARPYLETRAATHTADLLLVADAPVGSGQFNFDGASAGQMTVTVPVGWRVVVECINDSTQLSHSCAIIQPRSSVVAFAGAAIARPRFGLRPGGSQRFSFTASRVGSYQIACLVAGHRQAGMWDRFVVRPGGRPAIRGAVRAS